MRVESVVITTIQLHSSFHFVNMNIAFFFLNMIFNPFTIVDVTDMLEIGSFILFYFLCGRNNHGLMLSVFSRILHCMIVFSLLCSICLCVSATLF